MYSVERRESKGLWEDVHANKRKGLSIEEGSQNDGNSSNSSITERPEVHQHAARKDSMATVLFTSPHCLLAVETLLVCIHETEGSCCESAIMNWFESEAEWCDLGEAMLTSALF